MNATRNMLAIEIAQAGGPEVLRAVDWAVPRPMPGEVLIKVAAAGVNRPDIMQRKGMYPPPAGASHIPGLEVAGEIVECADDVNGLVPGDSVCALVTGGGYAEYCTAADILCLPVPGKLNEVEAAALPETYFTVWSNIMDRGALQSGETLLVHGGSSGIGTTTIQLAKAFGAQVFTTAGNDEKCRFCEQLGAQMAVNYEADDFVERVREQTDGAGVNLILDIIGGDYLQRNLACLAVEGRLVQIALQRGPKTEINLLPIMLKRLTLTGSTLRPRGVDEKATIAEALKEKVWPLIDQGVLRPIIHATFPLDQAADAHRLMESSLHIGKIVLTN